MRLHAKSTPLGCLIFAVCVWATWMFNLSIFSWQKRPVLNQPRITHFTQIWNRSASHAPSQKPPCVSAFLHLHLHLHNSSWSCCQTALPLSLRDGRAPERFVPRRIKHVTGPPGNQGRWVRRGNSSSRRSFVFSDPPLVQIIMSDSQMCPSLEMWLMSHLVSEDLGAGFEWRIKGTASFIRNTGSRWVMASLRLLRLASDWMVATFFRDWGGSGVKEVSWSPTVTFRKGRDKSCLSADVKVSNVGTIQRKIFYTF